MWDRLWSLYLRRENSKSWTQEWLFEDSGFLKFSPVYCFARYIVSILELDVSVPQLLTLLTKWNAPRDINGNYSKYFSFELRMLKHEKSGWRESNVSISNDWLWRCWKIPLLVRLDHVTQFFVTHSGTTSIKKKIMCCNSDYLKVTSPSISKDSKVKKSLRTQSLVAHWLIIFLLKASYCIIKFVLKNVWPLNLLVSTESSNMLANLYKITFKLKATSARFTGLHDSRPPARGLIFNCVYG